MLPGFANKTVTIERAPYVEQRGTKVRDWANAQTFTVSGCFVDYSSSSTRWNDVRQAITIRARLWLPPDADIREGDRITYRGNQYAIEGAPFYRESPTGGLDHIECALIDWSA